MSAEDRPDIGNGSGCECPPTRMTEPRHPNDPSIWGCVSDVHKLSAGFEWNDPDVRTQVVEQSESRQTLAMVDRSAWA